MAPRCFVQDAFLSTNRMIQAEPTRDLQGPAWHDMKQRFYSVCQIYWEKKINATWQHYIKSLCALIFLFCPCTFVWGVPSRSRGPGEQSWQEQCGNPRRKLCMLSFRRCCCCRDSERGCIFTDHFILLHHPSRPTALPATSPQIHYMAPEYFGDENVQNKCLGSASTENSELMCAIKWVLMWHYCWLTIICLLCLSLRV